MFNDILKKKRMMGPILLISILVFIILTRFIFALINPILDSNNEIYTGKTKRIMYLENNKNGCVIKQQNNFLVITGSPLTINDPGIVSTVSTAITSLIGKCSAIVKCYVQLFDEKWEPITDKFQLSNYDNLNTCNSFNYKDLIYSHGTLGPEDTRVINHNGYSYLFYTKYNGIYRKRMMHIQKLIINQNSKSIKRYITCNKPIPLLYSKMGKIEKNWSPFIFRNNIYLSYMIEPHTILAMDVKTGECTEISKISSPLLKKLKEEVCLRGGSPSYSLGDYYLSFIHALPKSRSTYLIPKSAPDYIRLVARNVDPRKYYTLAILFSNKPPFQVKAISPFLHLSRERVLFPTNFYLEKDKIYLSAGESDKATVLIELDLTELMSMMKWN